MCSQSSAMQHWRLTVLELRDKVVHQYNVDKDKASTMGYWEMIDLIESIEYPIKSST